MITNTLIEGNPLAPDGTDIIAQTVHLPMNELPDGKHWRIMTGNITHNKWMRTVYRYDITGEL